MQDHIDPQRRYLCRHVHTNGLRRKRRCAVCEKRRDGEDQQHGNGFDAQGQDEAA